MEEFFTNAAVENIYLSYHDAIRIVTEKSSWLLYNSIISYIIKQERKIHLAMYSG